VSICCVHAVAQEILPFPPTPSASTAGRTLQESQHKRRVEPKRLPANAPNILIILIDDVGNGVPSTYGGEVNTPTLSRVAKTGVSFNRFHSTAMCSPTRAAILTGRNHTRVGNGQITELANDWDGFSGTIPKTSATVAEVLKNYGYNTAAFGKWHSTPATHTTKMGPFEYWPAGYGFEYFYGFLAGEASQYEPALVKNTTYIETPHKPGKEYHLTEDLADNAIEWINNQHAIEPEKPFLMYWATGASHGPHHIMKEWADKYKGKFDDGWDKYRERVFARQKAMGWIPANAQLTARPETLASWESIPENEKPFQRRLMELFAGFTEHADYNAGRILDALEKIGELENTLIFYIWGDNGSSAEGQLGSISELLAQNQIPSTVEQQLKALNKMGGLNVLGTPRADNMYHAGWAWAGSTPYKATKLIASYFGGTRQPLAVSWPKNIKPASTPLSQFHHVIDIVPTIYELLDIKAPVSVNAFPQDPIDGVSMVYSLKNPAAKGTRTTQFFDIMGSRGIYHNGWMASTFGPRIPWISRTPGMETWTPDRDVWELYNIEEDFSQANDLAAKFPEKLAAMKEMFLIESAKNNNLPIGGGLYVMYNPGGAIQNPGQEFHYDGKFTRLPEFVAPKIGTRPNSVSVDCDIPANANGVLFSLGAYSGGLTCFMENGFLVYEYNLFEVERTIVRSKTKLPAGRTKIEVELRLRNHPSNIASFHTGEISVKVNGAEMAKGTVPTLATLAFTANDCFDVGTDLGSPVSESYFSKAPFSFNGKIHSVDIKYIKQQ
jgi:arylsulfatase A-like enzyme